MWYLQTRAKKMIFQCYNRLTVEHIKSPNIIWFYMDPAQTSSIYQSEILNQQIRPKLTSMCCQIYNEIWCYESRQLYTTISLLSLRLTSFSRYYALLRSMTSKLVNGEGSGNVKILHIDWCNEWVPVYFCSSRCWTCDCSYFTSFFQSLKACM